MAQRGRKSAASQEIAPFASVAAQVRPDAPYELTDEQAEVWRSVIDDLPADWFRPSNHQLLIQYSRHVVAARHVAQLISDFEKSDGECDVSAYKKLLAMQELEGRAISSLATRMRLTQQAIFDKKVSKPQAKPKPWAG